jgi:hypothetical protein
VEGCDRDEVNGADARKPVVRPTSVTVARTLFVVNAAVWFVLGLVSLSRVADSTAGHGTTTLIIASMMFGNGVVMLGLGWVIGTRQKRAYYLALAVLAINILLTFTDQFGLLDLATLLLDVLLLAALLATRSRYSFATRTR